MDIYVKILEMAALAWKRLATIDIILRLICGPLIFVSAIFAAVANFLIDWADSEIFKAAGHTKSYYNKWDKFLDIYWYLFILGFVFIKGVPGLYIFIVLFLYRLIGQIIFFITQNDRYFFIFANIFEIYFYFYLFTTIAPILKPFLYWPSAIYPLIIITPIVLVREYIAHIKRANLSWFFTGKTTYWIDEGPNDKNSIS